MFTIGLTGGIACGKSMVSHYFEQLSIPVIDTDIIARQLVARGKPALLEIIKVFGNNIVDKNNNLNRKLLRTIIFKSPDKRLQLESILHPKILATVIEKLAHINKKNPYCVVVIPLLFETKSIYPIDRILLVDCSEQEQIKRCMRRDNITYEQSLSIISNQIARSERLKKADDTIKNDSDSDNCYSQIQYFHEKYQKLAKQQ